MLLRYKGKLYERIDAMDPNIEKFGKFANEIASKLKTEICEHSGYEISKYKATIIKSGRNAGIDVSFVSNPSQGIISHHFNAANYSYGAGQGLMRLGEPEDIHAVVRTFFQHEVNPHSLLKKGEKSEHGHINFEALNEVEHSIKTIAKISNDIAQIDLTTLRHAIKEGNEKEANSAKKRLLAFVKHLTRYTSTAESKSKKI